MCFGTFDHLHPGHLSYLTQAKEYGDYLIVVVARDKVVERIKGRLPVESEELRVQNLELVEFLDEVCLGNLKDKYKVVRDEKPDVICLGYDQQVDLEELKNNFSGKIIRLKPYKPDIYKSSKMKKIQS